MAVRKRSNIFVCGKDDEAMMRYFEMLTSESSSSENEMVCDNIRLVAENQSRAADETDNSSSESGEDNTAVDTSCGNVFDWKSVMPQRHFVALNKYLHLVDNETLDPADPLRKICPIISTASDSFRAVYTPSGRVCIDESLTKCRGRLHVIQYNKSKRARFGIKFYKLCDPANSYISQQLAIVMEMMQKCDLLNKGYLLYIDNWYSSPDLFHRLFSAGTNLHGKKDRTFHVFKQKLAEQLLESYFKEDVVKRRSATPEDLPSRLSGRHFPEKLAPSAAKGQNSQNVVLHA
ncbi:hypothetical protein PR048_027677 [Dryococelus australis]|uniref:PiggyBac transposable element-derived protein domain-containing protein n=1 Tax=Dryococelus australis TaxID=614101 RepID=A0ABQ9GH74_9NEOP|nr:hypothetical protein PR048_027677 [Dryococelus australis]